MGATSREFIKLRTDKDYYDSLPPLMRDRFEVIAVDIQDFDYSKDTLHQELKKKSNKAYKDVKKREYELRHNIINK
jgi:uncharacterized membrane protein YcaP (DUF421 family)